MNGNGNGDSNGNGNGNGSNGNGNSSSSNNNYDPFAGERSVLSEDFIAELKVRQSEIRVDGEGDAGSAGDGDNTSSTDSTNASTLTPVINNETDVELIRRTVVSVSMINAELVNEWLNTRDGKFWWRNLVNNEVGKRLDAALAASRKDATWAKQLAGNLIIQNDRIAEQVRKSRGEFERLQRVIENVFGELDAGISDGLDGLDGDEDSSGD